MESLQTNTAGGMEYQVIWEGGDLGIALIPLAPGLGVACSRVTGKGLPQGIENVASDDVLLSINQIDTTRMTFDDVIHTLKECDLPAILQFRKTVSQSVPLELKNADLAIPTSPTGSSIKINDSSRPWKSSKGKRESSVLLKKSMPSQSYRPSSVIITDTMVAVPGKKSSMDFMEALNVATREVEEEGRIKKLSVDTANLVTSQETVIESPVLSDQDLPSKDMTEDKISIPAAPTSIGSIALKSDMISVSNLVDDSASLSSRKSGSRMPLYIAVNNGRSNLHHLCAIGNLQGVIKHVRAKGWKDLGLCEDKHGQSGLHLAVKSGNVQLVKLILEQCEGIQEILELQDSKGNTVMHFAATKTPEMVHRLHTAGAKANVKNAQTCTPLVIAIITSKQDCVIIPRMLLKFGGNCNDIYQNQSVLHSAIDRDRLQIAGALVHAGADMSTFDANNRSLYSKLKHASLRHLLSQIYHPPSIISTKIQKECMLCKCKSSFRNRLTNCTHCGRACCIECASLSIEACKFPQGFPKRLDSGAANLEKKQICKTCFGIFKERNGTNAKLKNRFVRRVVGIEWDEINPPK